MKNIRLIIPALVILLIGALIYCIFNIINITWSIGGVFLGKDTPQMEKPELEILLIDNREAFENVANIMISYPEIIEIDRLRFHRNREDRFYYTINNNHYTITSRKILDDKIVAELEESQISKILEDLKFMSVLNMEDCVYFTEGANLAYANGIVYSPNKEEPAYEYLIKLEKIVDKWFYFQHR